MKKIHQKRGYYCWNNPATKVTLPGISVGLGWGYPMERLPKIALGTDSLEKITDGSI